MHAIVALGLFVAVVALVAWRPRGLSVGWPAAIGGLLAIALGVVTFHQVKAVLGLVWDPTLTFIALIIMSLVLDRVGLFEWAALHMVRWAGLQTARLFVVTLLV